MGYYSWSERRDDCAYCGERLTYRQERFCGNACRMAYRRYERAAKNPGTCALCGESFIPRRPRQTVCDYEDEADEICLARQDARDDELAAAAYALDVRREAACEHCGKEVKRSKTGRIAKYCNNRCRQNAYHTRKKAGAR